MLGALLTIFTVTPAEPAAADNVTVPTTVPPPTTLVWFKAGQLRDGHYLYVHHFLHVHCLERSGYEHQA
ncbi:MAG: hypothetical protein DMF57_03555 [Acidobacteria bacterium]|nr:MAG: hypothetical protein DMF57_03555 [Acidobacteriota bacterium]